MQRWVGKSWNRKLIARLGPDNFYYTANNDVFWYIMTVSTKRSISTFKACHLRGDLNIR